MFNDNINTLIGGDFNSKNVIRGCRNNNNNGIALHNIISKTKLKVIASIQPTYYPCFANHRPDVLDFFISNFKNSICANAINELSSDHLPVFATIAQDTPNPQRMINITDWQLYTNILIKNNTSINQLQTTEDINNAIDNITLNIKNAHKEATHSKPLIPHYMKLPPIIKSLIKQRNWIRKQWRNSMDPNYKTELNRLNKLIKKKCVVSTCLVRPPR